MINDVRKAVKMMTLFGDLISAAVCSFSFNLLKRDLDSPLIIIICLFPHFGSKEHPPTTLNTVALLFIFVLCAGFSLSCWFSVVLAAQNVKISLMVGPKMAKLQI